MGPGSRDEHRRTPSIPWMNSTGSWGAIGALGDTAYEDGSLWYTGREPKGPWPPWAFETAYTKGKQIGKKTATPLRLSPICLTFLG